MSEVGNNHLIISIPSLSSRIGGGEGNLEGVACKHGCGIADVIVGVGEGQEKVDTKRFFIIAFSGPTPDR